MNFDKNQQEWIDLNRYFGAHEDDEEEEKKEEQTAEEK